MAGSLQFARCLDDEGEDREERLVRLFVDYGGCAWVGWLDALILKKWVYVQECIYRV